MPHRSTRRSAPLSPELRRLVDRAYRGREFQVREIVARSRRLYPHYRALSGPALEGLRQNVRYLVAGFYQRGLVEGRVGTDKELEPTIRMTRLRVAQGVPLDEMVGCYQLALPILWEDLIEIAGPHPRIHLELLRRLSVTLSSLARVITAVIEAFVEERERLQRSREEAIDDFLRMLLSDEAPASVLEARARTLGIGLDVPRMAALFCPAPGRAIGRRDAEVELLQRRLAERVPASGAVFGRVPEGVLALLPAGAGGAAVLEEVAARLPKRRWRTGVGTRALGASALRRSVRQAKRAVEIGALLREDRRVVRYAEVDLLDLVDLGSARASEFARDVLGPLADSGPKEIYRKTLHAACRHGFHMKLAAGALGIHPNTMSYRAAQLRQRFGIDLEDPSTRMRLQLALLILDAG